MVHRREIKKKILNLAYEGAVFVGIGAGIFLGKQGCEYVSAKATWKYVILNKGGGFVVKEPVYEGPFPDILRFTEKPKSKEIEELLRSDPDSIVFKIKMDSLLIFYHLIECPWWEWCGYYSTDGSVHILSREGMEITLRHELYHKWQAHGQTAEEFSASVDRAARVLNDYLEGRMEAAEREMFEDFWLCYFNSLPDRGFYTTERLDFVAQRLKEMRKRMSLDDMLKRLDGWEYNFVLYVIELEANSHGGDFGLSQ